MKTANFEGLCCKRQICYKLYFVKVKTVDVNNANNKRCLYTVCSIYTVERQLSEPLG